MIIVAMYLYCSDTNSYLIHHILDHILWEDLVPVVVPLLEHAHSHNNQQVAGVLDEPYSQLTSLIGVAVKARQAT